MDDPNSDPLSSCNPLISNRDETSCPSSRAAETGHMSYLSRNDTIGGCRLTASGCTSMCTASSTSWKGIKSNRVCVCVCVCVCWNACARVNGVDSSIHDCDPTNCTCKCKRSDRWYSHRAHRVRAPTLGHGGCCAVWLHRAPTVRRVCVCWEKLNEC